MTNIFYERHSDLLQKACEAIEARAYWSAYQEVPSTKYYGEAADVEGHSAFSSRLGQPFNLRQSATVGEVGAEVSPFGIELGVTYPKADLEILIDAIKLASKEWRRAGPEIWTGVCLEILARLNAHSFEMAHAIMHTTGQAFMMSFQAGAPHAQERGLEAVAYAWSEMNRIPAIAIWEKPQGKKAPIRMEKHFKIVPRGIGLVIGCSTFPTWNGYPGLFANLSCGNAVIVKPHPRAILPLALTVKVAREVLIEAGFDPDVVTLVAHEEHDNTATTLATHPDVRLIDFTGSSKNGTWLERNAYQAHVYTEKSGVNQIVVDSTTDLVAMANNIAFSLTLYSGQMCTAPQNIYIPKSGIETDTGHISFAEVVHAIREGVISLTSDPIRAVEITGAIQSPDINNRIALARSLGTIILDSTSLMHPIYPNAHISTPLIVEMQAVDEEKIMQEFFGPISFVVATDSTANSIDIAKRTVLKHGAMTLSVYSRDKDVIAQTLEAAEESGVALSINLMGSVYVNQTAAFSDFHGTGANPAANTALSDSAFVANRFRVVQSRSHL